MTRVLQYLALPLLAAVVAACAADDMQGTSDVISGTYACDRGKSFAFATERGSSTVTLELDGRSYQLEQREGFGTDRTRYSDGTLTLSASSNGRFASLEGAAEPYSNCEAVAWERGGVIE